MREHRLPVTAYERAERMLGHNRDRLALRARVTPRWIGDGSTFWYRVDTERGTEFIVADPEAAAPAGRHRPAFDHERLARSLAAASGTGVEAYDLPFRTIELTADTVSFDAFGTRWTCRLPGYDCARDDGRRPRTPLEVPSPDGRWVAFRRGHDLWLRSLSPDGAGPAGGDGAEADAGNGVGGSRVRDEFAVTTDGTAERPYACNPESAGDRWWLRMIGIFEAPPVVLWSPDSARLLFHVVDQRGVAPIHLVEAAPAGGTRPRLHEYRYAMPGEALPRGEWLVFDVRSRTLVPAPAPADPFTIPYLSPIRLGNAWWSDDGSAAYHLDQSRDLRTLRLRAIDPATGGVRTVIEETGETRVEAAQELVQKPVVRVLAGGREALWYSQRDGWGHVYLYDLRTGRTVRQITRGAYAVQQIVHVDEEDRVAYLSVSGLVADDPYRRSLVRAALDGEDTREATGEDGREDTGEDTNAGTHGMERVAGDDLDHVVVAPPHGRWFVDSASTVDTPPVISVRGRDGTVLAELERADISRLIDAGWSPPERIRTLAADGETPIYGVLHKPYGFDPARSYPVVDHPYPGPQMRRVQASFHPGWAAFGYDAEAVAALGFVVIAVDGRGTPGRDKAFHDHSFRNMGAAGGLEDHVAALRQLAETRPWMDLDRVGIFGHSGGGFATVRAMLAYPETYKVGVAESGNHDNRRYLAVWTETYDGPFASPAELDGPEVGARLSNTELAGDLAGRLLLVHGEMDDNVTPHLTMRLVDRLIAANKDFDMLIVPGAEHSLLGYEHYVTRRRWDYLVRHLMHREPPAYALAKIPVRPELLELFLG